MPAPSTSARDEPLRAVIAGLGVMGTNHLRVLSSMADAVVTAVVDPDSDRRSSALRMFPETRGYGSLEEALSREDLDFACLAVPAEALPESTQVALSAGLNVFVEKPMATSEDQAREMIAAADERDLVLGVGYVERCNPAVVALKQKLDAGAIGRIIQMHARRLSPFPKREGNASVALDLATHDIDIMRYLSGSEVERVSAEAVSKVGEGQRVDLICSTLRFESDATGLLEANWITPTKIRELSVLGEGGMFVVNYLTQDLTFYEHPTTSTGWDRLASMTGGEEGDMTRYALNRREPLRIQWEGFVGAVRSGSRAPVDGGDGLRALSIARAIETSGVEHRAVTPSYRETAVD